MNYREALLTFLYRTGGCNQDITNEIKRLLLKPEMVTDERVKYLFSLGSHIGWSRYISTIIYNFLIKNKWAISKPTPDLKDWKDSQLIQLLSTDLTGKLADNLLHLLYNTAKDINTTRGKNENLELLNLKRLFPKTEWIKTEEEEDILGIDYKSTTGKTLQVKVADYTINSDLFSDNYIINIEGNIDLNHIIKHPNNVDRLLIFSKDFRYALLIDHQKVEMIQKSTNSQIITKPDNYIEYKRTNDKWNKLN